MYSTQAHAARHRAAMPAPAYHRAYVAKLARRMLARAHRPARSACVAWCHLGQGYGAPLVGMAFTFAPNYGHNVAAYTV